LWDSQITEDTAVDNVFITMAAARSAMMTLRKEKGNRFHGKASSPQGFELSR